MRALLFDDDMADLQLRVARAKSGLVSAEDPSSRMVRKVANVPDNTGESPASLELSSIVSIFCRRRDEEEVLPFIRRQGRLCRERGKFRIVGRNFSFEYPAFRNGNPAFLV